MEPNFYRSPYSFYFPNRYRYMPNRNNGYYNYAQKDNTKTDFNMSSKPEVDEIRGNPNNKPDDKRADAPIFEIFGIKLFFDDILLVSLIFFLYNEGVKDQSLFIALILLLLS